MSKPASFERWFPNGIHRPIRYPFPKQNDDADGLISQPKPPPERVFHFTKEKIGALKAKANAEVNDNNNDKTSMISSLQAVLSHVWRCMMKHHHLDPQEDVSCRLAIGTRQRMLDPPLAENYAGNAYYLSTLTMKAGELVEVGLGKAALEMNKMIGSHTEEQLRELYEGWVKNPVFIVRREYTVTASSSPRFDIYGNDFGWGKPVAVRSGAANKFHGKITVFGGAEEGSMDVEVCIGYEILEAMARDHEFMDAVSI